jgi:hypothetical protein
MIQTQRMMAAPITAVAIGRLNARPPSVTGLSRKSPSVAPKGRVKMNAAQNSNTRDVRVQK